MRLENAFEKSLIVEYLREFENLMLGKADAKEYAKHQEQRAQKLYTLHPDAQIFHLMQAAALIRVGKKEDGEAILKKYEHNHALQLRNEEFRACFLYLAGVLCEDQLQRKNIVLQLQKLYQKDHTQPSLYWYLVRLDDTFEKNPEKKLAFLEKQWKLGCRQNLLFLEAVLTLREHPAMETELDDFILQCCLWALRRKALQKEMATLIGRHAMRLRSCDRRYEYLLRECYRIFSTKELLAAICSLYIRDARTDRTAAKYYARGVEFELKLNNLYEYYMMATTEQKKKLLPEQVLLYFLYHNTLSGAQRVFLYKNIVAYADPESEIYEKYRGRIENYTVDSLLKRRISPEYAYLYEHVLCPQIFTKEMAEAMADLMFLRKVTCTDARIRRVEISYEQLGSTVTSTFKKQQAYLPVYSPGAVVTLVDDVGNLYRNTIPYKLEKLIDERKYIEVCKQHVKNHPGLLLHLCGKKAENVTINEDNLPFYEQIPQTAGFAQSYRNAVTLKLLEYGRSQRVDVALPADWAQMDGRVMSREQRGRMITYLAAHQAYEKAFAWLEDYGAVYVSANTILQILTALSDTAAAEKELYYRLCYGCFQNGQMNYTSLKYLADSFLGTCAQMAEVWKQAKAFGVDTFELEERILVQMMFTGTALACDFEIYLSYNQRDPREYVKKAYLTYLSREAFVKERVLDGRFYFLLEEELFLSNGYAQICKLAYLKHLSGKTNLSAKQKKLCTEYLKEFFAKKCYFSFMQDFGRLIPEALVLEDQLFVEYRAPASSEVILHYIMEKDALNDCRYTTCRLYAAYGGVYTKTFTMFEGEKLTYFFTERREDGTEHSTAPVSVEKESGFFDSGTVYGRLNSMKQLLAAGRSRELKMEMQQYQFLEMAVKHLFSAK